MGTPTGRCAIETLPISIPDAIISLTTQQRIEELIDQGATYERASRSPNTIRSYLSDWRQFATWVTDLGVSLDHDPDNLAEPISAELVYLYVVDSASTRKPPTLARHLSAIRHWHHRKDLPSPTDHPRVMTTLAGIRRTHTYRRQQAQPLYLEDLRTALSLLPDTMRAARDRAALLVGWWGAFRRSELVGLNISNLQDHPEGLLVTLERSKTDQESEGRKIALHYHRDDVCPVLALRTWLQRSNRRKGPILCGVDRWGHPSGVKLASQTVSDIVKAAVSSIGLDPTNFSAHSLRSGFVSECDRRAINSSAVRLVTGHQSDAMLGVYQRPRSLFADSAGAYFSDE